MIKMMTIINSSAPILLFVIIGGLMAFLFVFSQKKSITLIKTERNGFSPGKVYLFSFLRIMISSGFLLFAFLHSIISGFACLISFVVTRWLALLFLLKKASGEV